MKKKQMTFSIPSVQREPLGFTLVEVMVALGILAIGILALATLQVSSLRGTMLADGVTEATVIAGDRLEQLMGLPFGDAQLADTNGDGEAGLTDTGADADHSDVDPSGRYNIFWDCAQDVGVINTVTIGMTVVWQDHGIQKSVYLQHIKPSTN